VQLFFVGKYFSDKIFVGESLKDPPYHTNFGWARAALGALGFFWHCQPMVGYGSYL
jgi:hypothetical protein